MSTSTPTTPNTHQGETEMPGLDETMLDEVMLNMSVLYGEIRSGATELRTAAELANVSGKLLKAYQLKLATRMFAGQLGKRVDTLAQLVNQTA